jgi:hypothetical protein
MNQEIKALWVQWLRDNADKQGNGALNRNGEFCCLGGLCELAVAAGVAGVFLSDSTLSIYGPIDTEPNDEGRDGWADALLPQVVSEWAGLGIEHNPIVLAGDVPTGVALTELNDEWELNFHQIADLIEAQL